jgi:quinol monooxygenase YgiN
MGVLVIACYRPHPGRAVELLELVRGHVPALRVQDLATEREPIVMRAADGTILEVFEWASQDAIERAHANPVVQDLWKRFEAVCSYVKPADVAELHALFAPLRPVDLA